MCFNEINFLMLLQYVKVLKIEYNIFIINFIWNYYLTTRCEFKIQKILNYINRKFDVRILLNYVRSLKNFNVYNFDFNNNVTKSKLKKLKRIERNVTNYVRRVVVEFTLRFSKTNNRLLIM